MPTYIATVRDASGAQKQVRIGAPTPIEARANLRQQGLSIQNIRQSQGFDLDSLAKLDIGDLLATVSVKDKAVYSRQMATMIDAGLPIVRSLGILADQTPNPKLKKSLLEISSQVQQGNDL